MSRMNPLRSIVRAKKWVYFKQSENGALALVGTGAYVKKPYVMEKIGVAIWDELYRKIHDGISNSTNDNHRF